MYRTILVALDGSKLAEQVLPYARTIARTSGAQLILVRVVQPETFAGIGPIDEPAEAMREAERYLEGVAAALSGVAAIEGAVFYGDPAETILREAGQRSADLIVMSTHGRSGIGRWLYGSVADAVLRHSAIPVLVIPSTVDRAWIDDRVPRIMVPLDGSVHAVEALEQARQMATLFRSELLLVRIVVPPVLAYAGTHPYVADAAAVPQDFDYETERAAAEEELARVAADLQSSGFAVRTHVTLGNPVTQLPVIARNESVDLVVMATHGVGGLARLMIGSVATGMLQRSTLPVLLVRPPAVRRRALSAATTTPEPAEAGKQVALSLSTDDLDLIERSLQDRLDRQPDAPDAAELQALIGRLRDARSEGTA